MERHGPDVDTSWGRVDGQGGRLFFVVYGRAARLLINQRALSPLELGVCNTVQVKKGMPCTEEQSNQICQIKPASKGKANKGSMGEKQIRSGRIVPLCAMHALAILAKVPPLSGLVSNQLQINRKPEPSEADLSCQARASASETDERR